TNLIPACLRQRFNLWSPTFLEPNLLSEEDYAYEYDIAHRLANEIEKRTDILLPYIEISHLALMLRAAYIRERPQELKDVLVVCPSGMATAQLLVARLKARFSRLGNLQVISLRELSDKRYATVDLIISTVPLSQENIKTEVLHVHPLLLPEDITAITQWLAQ
ncbi:MAG: PRD domain-containing protein, partial [Chloroflexota bacterium]